MNFCLLFWFLQIRCRARLLVQNKQAQGPGQNLKVRLVVRSKKKVQQEILSLGSYLRFCRIDKGFSQLMLAEKLGYKTAQFISHWETGRSSPPLDKLAKCIHLLDMDGDQVLRILLAETEDHIRKKMKMARSPLKAV